MNIEITAAEAGMMIAFVIAIVGIGMGIRLRALRKKKQIEKREKEWKEGKSKVTEEYEFKTNPETLAPEKVPKNPEQGKEKPQHDVDALLDDLKKDSD